MFIRPAKITGWVNGNFYLPSTEVLGILPVPPEIQSTSGMTEYLPSLGTKWRHKFLAEMQGTNKAILPIHNHTEKELFRELMRTNTDFNSSGGPSNWDRAARVWNSYANANDVVFYKVCLCSLLFWCVFHA